jgi:hypothetical protein
MYPEHVVLRDLVSWLSKCPVSDRVMPPVSRGVSDASQSSGMHAVIALESELRNLLALLLTGWVLRFSVLHFNKVPVVRALVCSVVLVELVDVRGSNTKTNMFPQDRMCAYLQTHTHARARTHTITHTRTHTLTHIRTHTHAHTHTHKQ